MQKTIMLLGGIRYLLPVIDVAHKEGYHVITADYLPDNIAHKYSDEYVNVSITDREAVLKAAIEKRIDGIMSFGVDPGVVTAAYVQNQLGLPSFGPLESVEILQDKGRFREFLRKNGFNVPRHKSFSSPDAAMKESPLFTYPVIVKPTDSAGSKGVSKVDSPNNLFIAVSKAFSHSLSKRIIIEHFIEKKRHSSDSDCFLDNGRLAFVSFSSQHFDEKASNPYTPSAYSWPSTFSKEEEQYLASDLQRLLSLLNMKTGLYNIETRIGLDGKPYIMEASPRGGGNRLSEMIRYGTGVDLIKACVSYCVGDPFDSVCQSSFSGHWGEIILHSNTAGVFMGVRFSDTLIPYIVDNDIWVEPGHIINSFNGANDTIGTLVLRFPNQELLETVISNPSAYINIITE